jgi:hypothetical protein
MTVDDRVFPRGGRALSELWHSSERKQKDPTMCRVLVEQWKSGRWPLFEKIGNAAGRHVYV